MKIDMSFLLVSTLVCIVFLIISFVSYQCKHIQQTIDNFLKQIIAYIFFSLFIIISYCFDSFVENPSEFATSVISVASIILCNMVALVCRKSNQNGTSDQYKHFVHAFVLSLSIVSLIEQQWFEFLTQFLNFILLYVSFNFDFNFEETQNKLIKYYKEDLGLISQKCILLIALFYVSSPLLEIMEKHKLTILLPWLVTLGICIVYITILILGTKKQKLSLRGTIKSILGDINNETSSHKRTAKISAEVNGQKRLIEVDLTNSNFRIACDAFRDGREILISGTLVARLGRYSIQGITNFTSA